MNIFELIVSKPDAVLIVLSRDYAAKNAEGIRARAQLPPWASIEDSRPNGIRIVIADVKDSFCLTYDNTIHFI